MPYRGRFAPTPSGPLHLGSLATALGSYLDARHARGRWLLRIDDLDRDRCRGDSESIILRQLEDHGLTWDESPRRQSAHVDAYAAALEQLHHAQRTYPCVCTRAQLMKHAHQGQDGPVYAGPCAQRSDPAAAAGLVGPRHSIRFRTSPVAINSDNAAQLEAPLNGHDLDEACLNDRFQGIVKRSLKYDIGDFVLRRSDGVFGYHLACAVDEAEQNISHVVRGADLLGATLAQRSLQALLNLSIPEYAHLPVLLDEHGRKLSKQNGAPALQTRHASENLQLALCALGLLLPRELIGAPPREIVQWAVRQWGLAAVPRRTALDLPSYRNSLHTPVSGMFL